MTQPDSQYNNYTEILQDIHRLTTFHGDAGLTYHHTAELQQFLHPADLGRKPPLTVQPRQQTKATPSQKTATQPIPAISEDVINNSKQQIADCNSCPHRTPPKFGIGTHNRPFIFIICDKNSSDPSRPMEEAEESLLAKMLQAIKIRPGQVFVTNLVKCRVATTSPQTDREMATNCLSHTTQQIRLMQPSMICTMGQLSSQTILNSTNQLMALRGHFHTYMDIPLMATYHPAQLIAIPELKKATWYDLQLMQRKLAGQ